MFCQPKVNLSSISEAVICRTPSHLPRWWDRRQSRSSTSLEANRIMLAGTAHRLWQWSLRRWDQAHSRIWDYECHRFLAPKPSARWISTRDIHSTWLPPPWWVSPSAIQWISKIFRITWYWVVKVSQPKLYRQQWTWHLSKSNQLMKSQKSVKSNSSLIKDRAPCNSPLRLYRPSRKVHTKSWPVTKITLKRCQLLRFRLSKI